MLSFIIRLWCSWYVSCKNSKSTILGTWFLEWVIWQSTGGRKSAVIPVGPVMENWKNFGLCRRTFWWERQKTKFWNLWKTYELRRNDVKEKNKGDNCFALYRGKLPCVELNKGKLNSGKQKGRLKSQIFSKEEQRKPRSYAEVALGVPSGEGSLPEGLQMGWMSSKPKTSRN